MINKKYFILLIFTFLKITPSFGSEEYDLSFKAEDGRKIYYTVQSPLEEKWEKDTSILIIQYGKGGYYQENKESTQILRKKFKHHVFGSMNWPHQGQRDSNEEEDPIHLDSFQEYIDYFHEFLDIIAPYEQKIDLIGLSMGANILLHYADQYPKRVKSLTLLSPMMAFPCYPFSFYGAYCVSSLMCSLGYSKSYAPGQGPFNLETFENCLLKQDNICKKKVKNFCNYLKNNKLKGSDGVTWGWLYAAIDACYKARTIKLSTEIPLTIVSTPDDPIVDASLHKTILYENNPHALFIEEKKMPHDTFLSTDGIFHEIFEKAGKNIDAKDE